MEPIIVSPDLEPQRPEPHLKQRHKLPLILLALCMVLTAAGFTYRLATTDDQYSTATTTKPSGRLVASIQNQSDLAALNAEQKNDFCSELLQYDPEAPEVTALHKRLGLSGDLYQNVYLGCSLTQSADDYTKKDLSGANDALYRKNAAEDRAVAKSFTFDTYDTTFTSKDLKLSKRVAIDISGEAKNLYMTYATLIDGGFNPYQTQEKIQIQQFDVRDFAGYTSNCGPSLMKIDTAQYRDGDPCTKLTAIILGQPVYKSEGVTYKAMYTLTVGNTRIVVEAENEDQALAVLKGLKKSPADKLDYFIKN